MPDKKLSDGTAVRTNLVPRELFSGYTLTDKEREQFDYYTSQEIDDQSFFRFKGNIYDIGEFMRTQAGGALERAGWDGADGQSAFHAVVVHLCTDGESVVVGEVFS